MTEPEPATDPVWLFIQALPPRLRHRLNRNATMVAHIHAATTLYGWTPAALAAYATTQLDGTHNAAGVIMARLAKAATTDHADLTGPIDSADRPRRVHTGCCDNGWIYDETSDPPRATKCLGNITEETF